MARDQKEDQEEAQFHPDDTAQLLRFNITKQRIVDLCNVPFQEDWFDEAKNYSSWNRAMNGHPTWEGLVNALEALNEQQKAHPRRYLPTDDPPEVDMLLAWMRAFPGAGAPWWHDVLKLSMPLGSFKAWYSGAPMHKDKVAEVKAKVDDWWARVMSACARAELASVGREFGNPGGGWRNPKITSHFYHLVVEKELPVEDARVLYQDMMEASVDHHSTLIDLTDPQDPLVRWDDVSHRDAYGQEFDAMVAEGYPGATAQFTEPFEPVDVTEERRWGDRRDEDSPKDLNEELYNLHYRVRTCRYWNPDTRRSDGDSEITETSQDGVTWVPATERQKQGWDRGSYFFFESLNRGVYPENSYTRELNELNRSWAKEKELLQNAIDNSEIGEQEDRAWAAMNAAESRFEKAKIRLRLPE